MWKAILQPYAIASRLLIPKLTALIFFAPSEERENGLPKWWWELWRFLLALEFKQIIEPNFNVLMVAGRAVNAETATALRWDSPHGFRLPAMMKMRISTPHYLEANERKASPFGFVLHPVHAKQSETNAAHSI